MGPVGTERSLMGTMRRILCLCLLQSLKSDPGVCKQESLYIAPQLESCRKPARKFLNSECH